MELGGVLWRVSKGAPGVGICIWGEAYGVVNARAADCCSWDAAWLRVIPGPTVVLEMEGEMEEWEDEQRVTGRGKGRELRVWCICGICACELSAACPSSDHLARGGPHGPSSSHEHYHHHYAPLSHASQHLMRHSRP